MKRIISLCLAFILVFSMLPASFAASDEATQAAQSLHEVGLFNGVGTNADGTPIFDLDRAPTRHEAITMLVNLLGKGEEARLGTWETPFTDVEDWARPYVGYAYTNGLTGGTSKTTFGGEETVTAGQYITFVLLALGYTSGTDFRWDKSWELADQIKLTDGRYNAETKEFTRGDVAIISLSALSVPMKGTNQPLFQQILEEPDVEETPAELPVTIPEGPLSTTTLQGVWQAEEKSCNNADDILCTELVFSGNEVTYIRYYCDKTTKEISTVPDSNVIYGTGTFTLVNPTSGAFKYLTLNGLELKMNLQTELCATVQSDGSVKVETCGHPPMAILDYKGDSFSLYIQENWDRTCKRVHPIESKAAYVKDYIDGAIGNNQGTVGSSKLTTAEEDIILDKMKDAVKNQGLAGEFIKAALAYDGLLVIGEIGGMSYSKRLEAQTGMKNAEVAAMASCLLVKTDIADIRAILEKKTGTESIVNVLKTLEELYSVICNTTASTDHDQLLEMADAVIASSDALMQISDIILDKYFR